MKLFLIGLLTILLNIHGFGQIENEISGYIDSTQLIINNGRKLLVKNIQERNFEKTKEIYTYLISTDKLNNCKPFSYMEELYINCFLEDWENWLTLASNLDIYFVNYCYRDLVQINHFVYNAIIQDYSRIKASYSNLEKEEFELIDLFFTAITERNRANYRKKLKQLNSKEVNPKYQPFIHKFFPDRSKEPGVSPNISVAAGVAGIFLTGKFSKTFKNPILISMGADFNIDKYFFSLSMVANEMDVADATILENYNSTGLNLKYEKFNLVYAGLKSGYSLIDKQFIQVTPFISLNGGSITSKIFEPEEHRKQDEIEVFNSFVYGCGIHSELKLARWNSYIYRHRPPPGYLSFKLDAGYDTPAQYNIKELKGGFLYIKATIGLGFTNL